MNLSPIGWPLRTWMVVELFFAVSAMMSVTLHPALTAENFAWTIKPEVMAATFGAFYAALAPVLIGVLLSRHWETVRVFVLPGLFFTSAQLLVTLLHWERFAVGTGPFAIWFASYLLPPPVFLGCYLWQQARSSRPAEQSPLARWCRLALLAAGGLITAEAVIALAIPGWFSTWAPWTITPLNARALAGYFLLLGLLLLSMARENDHDRVVVVAPFLVLLLPVLGWQLARFPAQVQWAHPRLWLYGVAFAGLAALGAHLLVATRGTRAAARLD